MSWLAKGAGGRERTIAVVVDFVFLGIGSSLIAVARRVWRHS
jgi:hypothetical protein